MKQPPEKIQKLVAEREKLRKESKYKEGDKVRKQIEEAGYIVEDGKTGTRVFEQKKQEVTKSFLALFGSGEIAPSAVRVHDRVLSGMGKDRPSIVVLSTPAGFQPNVKVVCQEIKDFFEQHLINYHPRVSIVYANTLQGANDPNVVEPVNTADYIFTGPGSPTYAVRHMQDSLLAQKIQERVQAGASLGLASAATMAFSRFCLPVYEIYKAGLPLYWEDGLNFFAETFRELTIIPHFNNNEGGKKNDTSRAWMGKERFKRMLALLPLQQEIWGIDEHTAAIIDLTTKECTPMGKGKIWHVR